MPADRISKLLEDTRLLSPERLELVQALREIILGLDFSISEVVKYGGFLFSADKPFCGVFSYTKSAGFLEQFPDTRAVLLDLPSVLPHAARMLSRNKLENRAALCAADIPAPWGKVFAAKWVRERLETGNPHAVAFIPLASDTGVILAVAGTHGEPSSAVAGLQNAVQRLPGP